MKKTISAVVVLLAFTAQSYADPVYWTCKHLDDNTFPMTTYAYSTTSNCPPPPHSTPPWQTHSHIYAPATDTAVPQFFPIASRKLDQIMVIPPEPECVIHAFPPEQ